MNDSFYTLRKRRYLITEDTSFGSQSSRLKMLHFRHVQEFLLEERAEETGCSLLLLREEAASPSSDFFLAAVTAIAAELKRNRLWTLEDRLPRRPSPAITADGCSSELSEDLRLELFSMTRAAVGWSNPLSNLSSLSSSSTEVPLLKYWLTIMVLGMTRHESDFELELDFDLFSADVLWGQYDGK